MTTRLWWSAMLVAAVSGCDDTLADEAAPVGCRLGPQPCDVGEACVAGECVPADGKADRAPDPADFRVQVQPERDTLVADRRDPRNRMVVRLRIQDDAGEGFSGDVLLRAHPFAAATFDPVVVEMKAGLGATRVAGCDRDDADCPETFRVDVALDAWPTVVVGSSDAIRLDHGRPPPEDAAPAPEPADAGP